MIKVKTIFFLLLIGLFLNNCEYTPQYSKKNYENFSLEITNLSGDRDFNNYLEAKLNPYFNKEKSDIKNFKININSIYEKNITSKDSSGIATEYELKVTVNSQINLDKNTKEVKIVEKFYMKKMGDSFEESNYERTIKDNFSSMIKEKLMFYLLEMQ